jgi:hypothetical protein
MMAKLDDSLIMLVNDEISVEDHKAMSKAVENVQKAWKQQMNTALKSLLLARSEAASKWGARPYDKYIVKGDIKGPCFLSPHSRRCHQGCKA